MKAKDIQVGKTYAAKVSNTVVPVLVVEAFESFRSSLAGDPRGRTNWKCKNTVTGREIIVKSAQRFRHEIGPDGKPLFESVKQLLESKRDQLVKTASDPVMRQYQVAKDTHPGMLLLFQIGDFYELFDQDADKVSKLLGLTLTSRNGLPMCGFPHHQLEAYLHKLLKEGQKVAICEQVQDLANVPIRREVNRIVVPEEKSHESLLQP